MDDPSKKPRGPITLLLTSPQFRRRAGGVALLSCLLYVASLGPVCWLAGDNETSLTIIPYVYYPILQIEAATRGPTSRSPIAPAIEWYASLFRNDGAWPGLIGGEGTWFSLPTPDEEDLPQRTDSN